MGCFYNLWILFVGVFVTRALLFGVYTGAPEFWKLPYHDIKLQKLGLECRMNSAGAPSLFKLIWSLRTVTSKLGGF